MNWKPAVLALLIMACTNSNNENKIVKEEIDTTAAAQLTGDAGNWSGCYRAVQGRDTILLQLNESGSQVTGTMQYDNYGMDGNIGSIEAAIQQNRIMGYFRFFSEGMWSVREVIFEKGNGQLLQADTRQMQYKKDTAVFAHKQSLTWDSQRPFVRVDCSEIKMDTLPQ